MARLISVVVRSTGNQAADEGSESGSWGRSQPTVKGHGHRSNQRSVNMMDKLSTQQTSKPATVREGSSGSDIQLKDYGGPQGMGITKVVETTVEREYILEDEESQRSSGTTVRDYSGGTMVGVPVGMPVGSR
jgi:hypothetical protein